jgi:ActR/RegA family two-component response regulator
MTSSKLGRPARGERPSSRVLLVQNDSKAPTALHAALKGNGFEVVGKSTITEALRCLAVETFSALVCDLHLPNAGDGFTLVNAMRHFHPDAITVIMSNYPSLRESLSALLPQADEILVTPIPPQEVVILLNDRLRDPKYRLAKVHEPVATILERQSVSTIREWLARVNRNKELTDLALGDEAEPVIYAHWWSNWFSGSGSHISMKARQSCRWPRSRTERCANNKVIRRQCSSNNPESSRSVSSIPCATISAR